MIRNILTYGIVLCILSCGSATKEAEEIIPEENLTGLLKTYTVSTNAGSITYTPTYTDGEITSLAQSGVNGEYTFEITRDERNRIKVLKNVAGEEVQYYYDKGNFVSRVNLDKTFEYFTFSADSLYDYYYKQYQEGASIIYTEIRNYIWENGNVVSYRSNKPGVSFEEETFLYTTEKNPFKVLLEKWPIPLGFEPYIYSSNMPQSSSFIYEGSNFKYSYTLAANGDFLTYVIERKPEGAAAYQPYMRYEATYHE